MITVLRFLVNPVYFPLTVTAVIPILIRLAVKESLFHPDNNGDRTKISWIIFISTYTLFLFDLVIFSQVQIIELINPFEPEY